MNRLLKMSCLSLTLTAASGAVESVLAQDFIVHTATQGAKRVKSNATTGFTSTASTAFVNALSTNVVIPAGFNQARLVARFSAESFCVNVSWCAIRILVDGVEMNPVVGNNFAFDSPGDEWSGNMIERTSGIVLSGTRTVTVQMAVVGPGPTAPAFILDDMHLAVEVWRVS